MFEIQAPSGIIAIGDASLAPPSPAAKFPELLADLRERARRGELFFIESEEEVNYRIEIIVSDELPAALADEFEPKGGAFRLRLPTGQIQIGSLPPAKTRGQVDAAPGEYFVRPYARRSYDRARQDKVMTHLAGEADWRFARRLDNAGAFGCCLLILGAILLVIPYTRRFWKVILLAGCGPWLLYLLANMLPRYRRVQKLSAEREQQLPHFILVLQASPAAADIPGGWVPGYE